MRSSPVIVSDTNLTPVVQIITWMALATSVLAFSAHTGLKLYISNSLSLEITIGFFALVSSSCGNGDRNNNSQLFCAAQSLAVSIQTANGFGKPLNSLSRDTVQSQFKVEAEYIYCSLLTINRPNMQPTSFLSSQCVYQNWSLSHLLEL